MPGQMSNVNGGLILDEAHQKVERRRTRGAEKSGHGLIFPITDGRPGQRAGDSGPGSLTNAACLCRGRQASSTTWGRGTRLLGRGSLSRHRPSRSHVGARPRSSKFGIMTPIASVVRVRRCVLQFLQSARGRGTRPGVFVRLVTRSRCRPQDLGRLH